MTLFIGRSGWGALPPNRESANRSTTTHLFVHHSATLNPTDTPRPDDIEESKEQVRAFQRDHLSRTVTLPDGTVIPWADIAYNILVGPGVILEGRGWGVRGGGTGPGQSVPHKSGSWDNVSVSICVIGNYQTEHLDPLTRSALIDAMREARALYGDLIVKGDRDVNYTSCCGDDLYQQLPALWAEAKDDDMPTAKEVAAAIMDELVPIHDYTTGQDIEVPKRVAEGYALSELSLIRHHLTGEPTK